MRCVPIGADCSASRCTHELFLRGLGLTVEHHEGIGGVETLSSEGQTLLLLGDRRNLTPRQTERLLDWAAAGGHLVVVAERLWDENAGKSGDLLLDRLNLQQYATEELDESSQTTQSSTDEQHPQLTKLYLENARAPAFIAFATDLHAAAAARRWADHRPDR